MSPFAIEGIAGVTPIDTSEAAVTVSMVLPETEPRVAVIVVVPAPAADASPFEPEALLIAAVDVVPEDHVTLVVRSCVVASVYVPVAANCCVRPFAIEEFAGVTSIDARAAAVTVSMVVPETGPSVAVIAAVPTASVEARPLDPDALLIVAVAGVSEDQVTAVVMSCVVASVYVPVAVN